MVVLEQLPFTNHVRRRRNAAGGMLIADAAAQVVRVADEKIAEQHGSRIPIPGVDRCSSPPLAGVVKHVIVHQRGDVHHLHHRGKRVVHRPRPATGLAAK